MDNIIKIINRCNFLQINVLELDDATVGFLSYEVEGLSGFMNPVNIIAKPIDGKFPVIKYVNHDLLKKLGAGIKNKILNTNEYHKRNHKTS